ncbi:MAG: hypothetical protein EPN39_15655 [Chitinophagaceae bacterium]|nr:MAG: hypothetical protein EPN39_15655 [Chitinophagaceae bacterium]
MSSFPILDLVIGIIFIYFLLSIICSSAVELFLSIFKSRAGLLENWLKQIFNLPALDSEGKPLNVSVGQAIMDHCMVTALSKKGTSTSYIDAENFVSALLDKITIAPSGAGDTVEFPPANLAGYITAIQNSTLISGELKRTILIFANEAAQAALARSSTPASANNTAPVKSESEFFRDSLKNWFNSNADRLSGTFKRTKVFPLTIMVAIIMVISLNTDSIEICKYLYNNQAATKELATTAMNSFQNYQDQMDTLFKKDSAGNAATISELNVKTVQLKKDLDSLHDLDLPMGWKAKNVKDIKTFIDYLVKHLAGWLATILAIMMGAPFWFDILNKISNLRGTGPKPLSGDSADVKTN